MQIIIVDDNAAFVEALAGERWSEALEKGEETLLITPNQSPRQVAKTAVAQAVDDDTVVFINVNLKCAGHARQDQAGVEVLKFLRLTECFGDERNPLRSAHCVLYSFQNVEQLLRRKPSSLMICSGGVTFRQLPCDFSKLDVRALADDDANEAPADDLDEFLRGEFTLPDERHSWANWWAARQMFITYFNEQERPGERLTNYINPEIEDRQLRNGLYLYDHSEQLRALMAGEERQRVETLFQDIEENLGSLKVGLIDDEAYQVGPSLNFGWLQIYSLVLRSSVADLIAGFSIDLDDATARDLEKTFRNADLDAFACVLLDLRLKEESRRDTPVSQFSGAAVLKAIRQAEPTLPVIVTTASNKASSHEELMRLGADAYWVKRGIDERRNPEETFDHYVKFMELVRTATSAKYQFLRRFGQAVERLKLEDTLWWEKHRWTDEEEEKQTITRGNRERIFRFLDEALLMLRSYLHRYEMNYGYRAARPQGATLPEITLWSIMQHLGKVLEEVHRWIDLPRGEQSSRIIGGYKDDGRPVVRRGDWFGFQLYRRRNKASHLEPARRMDWEKMQKFVSAVLCYLEFGPQDEFRELYEDNSGIPPIEVMCVRSPRYDNRFNQLFHGE